MYLGLSGATAVNYIHAKRGFVNRLKLITGAFILPVLYGGFIEILQHYFFFPRMGDWDDFLANILGALVALFIAFQYRDYLIKKHI